MYTAHEFSQSEHPWVAFTQVRNRTCQQQKRKKKERNRTCLALQKFSRPLCIFMWKQHCLWGWDLCDFLWKILYAYLPIICWSLVTLTTMAGMLQRTWFRKKLMSYGFYNHCPSRTIPPPPHILPFVPSTCCPLVRRDWKCKRKTLYINFTLGLCWRSTASYSI